ncbi:hypothetical protein ACRRTK_018331 [Alexandromys fortis]
MEQEQWTQTDSPSTDSTGCLLPVQERIPMDWDCRSGNPKGRPHHRLKIALVKASPGTSSDTGNKDADQDEHRYSPITQIYKFRIPSLSTTCASTTCAHWNPTSGSPRGRP